MTESREFSQIRIVGIGKRRKHSHALVVAVEVKIRIFPTWSGRGPESLIAVHLANHLTGAPVAQEVADPVQLGARCRSLSIDSIDDGRRRPRVHLPDDLSLTTSKARSLTGRLA